MANASTRTIAKSLFPWIVSVAVCAVLLWPFRDADGRGALAAALDRASPWTAPCIVVFAIGIWLTDAWATVKDSVAPNE